MTVAYGTGRHDAKDQRPRCFGWGFRRAAAALLLLLGAWVAGSPPLRAQQPGARMIVLLEQLCGNPNFATGRGMYEFRDARVIGPAEEGQVRIEVQRDEPSEESAPAWALHPAPAAGHKPSLAAGDSVLVHAAPFWVVQQVRTVVGPKVTVVDGQGEAREVALADVQTIPERWRGSILRWAEEYREFRTALDAARGRPPAGRGAGPFRPGDVCAWLFGDDAWTEVEVKSVSGGKCTVLKWDEDPNQRESVEAEPATLVRCDKKAFPVRVGDIVYCRYRYFAHHLPWVRARVEQVRGERVIVATDHPGFTLELEPGEVLPLKK